MKKTWQERDLDKKYQFKDRRCWAPFKPLVTIERRVLGRKNHCSTRTYKLRAKSHVKKKILGIPKVLGFIVCRMKQQCCLLEIVVEKLALASFSLCIVWLLCLCVCVQKLSYMAAERVSLSLPHSLYLCLCYDHADS